MPCAGGNHDALAGSHRDQFVVQLHLRIFVTLEEVIRLGQPFVIVELGISRDVGDVDRARVGFDVGERTPGRSAGAFGSGDLGKIDQVVFGFCLRLAHCWSLRREFIRLVHALWVARGGGVNGPVVLRVVDRVAGGGLTAGSGFRQCEGFRSSPITHCRDQS